MPGKVWVGCWPIKITRHSIQGNQRAMDSLVPLRFAMRSSAGLALSQDRGCPVFWTQRNESRTSCLARGWLHLEDGPQPRRSCRCEPGSRVKIRVPPRKTKEWWFCLLAFLQSCPKTGSPMFAVACVMWGGGGGGEFGFVFYICIFFIGNPGQVAVGQGH